MRTTIDIPDEIFKEARGLATKEKTTLRSLLLEGLRWVLSQRKAPRKFRLKDASVRGEGVQPGVAEGNWEEIRDLVYRGRGT